MVNKTYQPTFISTFSGCGGSSLGYKLAGFKELLAVEYYDKAVETFKLNFPGIPVYLGDIKNLTSAECMKLANIKRGELDVLDGSPPCQGFSAAGKRRITDPRNSLFKEFVRLLNDIQPKVFIMENVVGLVTGYMKQEYLKIVEELRKCGYRVKSEILNAMYFNVPQNRSRVFIIGMRNDLEIEPSHPKPQTRPKTLRKAFAGLSIVDYEPIADISRYAIGKVWKESKPGIKLTKKFYSFKRAEWDKPSPILTKFTGNPSAASVTHPEMCRKYSIAEARRVSSFPDDFRFVGGWKEAIKCMGNSVPPNLMRAIAEHIKEKLLLTKSNE